MDDGLHARHADSRDSVSIFRECRYRRSGDYWLDIDGVEVVEDLNLQLYDFPESQE